jgi:hypothetical protein
VRLTLRPPYSFRADGQNSHFIEEVASGVNGCDMYIKEGSSRIMAGSEAFRDLLRFIPGKCRYSI